MGGNIIKMALNTIQMTSKENIEIHGDLIESIAKERVIEKGEDGGLDVKIGSYVSMNSDNNDYNI